MKTNPGICPVTGDTPVRVKLRDGGVKERLALRFNWELRNVPCDILEWERIDGQAKDR